MDIILSKIMQYLPFVTAHADGPEGTIGTVLSWIGTLGGGIVAIFMIISLIKDGIGIAKGSGDSSVLKVAGKVIFLIVILGLIGVCVNYTSISQTGEKMGNKAVDVINTEFDSAFGGAGGGAAG